MTSLTNLIRRNRQAPIRRAYIDRRKADDTFEGTWTRIDNYLAKDRVIDWGIGTWEINNEPGQIPSFEVTSLTMTFDNTEGTFNVESDTNSFWATEFEFIRIFSKLKIETGYVDDDESEVGVGDTFEGVISAININERGTAVVTILSYTTLLQEYDISDLSLTGTGTVSSVVDAIMNQSKITKYIPYIASVPDQNVTVDKTALQGPYWEVIKQLAFRSNSIPLLIGSSWEFKKREVAASSSFDFKGVGSTGADSDDILEISFYDDEGRDRVRIFWRNSEPGSSVTATSTNSTLLTKYQRRNQDIDLSILDSEPEKQTLLNALLSQWENPKPVIEFRTRFLVNEIEPLDKITLDIHGEYTQPENGFIWGAWNWGDGSVWGGFKGGINIWPGESWMVTKVEKNFNEWFCTIRAEKVV